jgi:hypothetical protein
MDSFTYFVVHWSSIAAIVNESSLRRGDPVYRYMEEIQLKRSASDMLRFLQPVGQAVDKFQRDSCTIGECYEIWHSLASEIPDEYVEHLQKRRKMGISPVMLAANLLDPRFAGAHMDPIEVGEAISYLKDINEASLGEVTKYMARHPPYSTNLFSDAIAEVHPGAWWKSGIQLGFNKAVADIVHPLVSGVGSSAGLERQFSTLGMNYGKLRASLGIKKAGKLAFLYRQLNSQ